MANKVTVVFDAVTTQAKRAIADLRGEMRQVEGATNKARVAGSSMGVALKTGLALGAAAAGSALVSFAQRSLEVGRELETMGAKAKTVFEGSLPQMEAWADGAAGAMGLTEERLLGAAAAFGDLIKPMGFTAEQAAMMTQDVLDLSGALSAWSAGKYNASEVSGILAKAMLGEREQLKELGISISEADVQARLAAKGQSKLTGATLAQAKAVATQELIMEKSLDAQKAWNDGTFDGVKKQNEAAAATQSLTDSLYKLAYPIVSEMTPRLGEYAEALEKVAAKGADAEESNRSFFQKFMDWQFAIPDTVSGWINGSDALGDLAETYGTAAEQGEKYDALNQRWIESQKAATAEADAAADSLADLAGHITANRIQLDQYNDQLERNRDNIDNLSDELYGYEEAQLALADAARQATEDYATLVDMQDDSEVSASELAAQNDATRQSIIDTAKAAFDAAQEFARQSGAQDGTKQSAELMTEELQRVQEQFPWLSAEIQKYIDELAKIPDDISTKVRLIGPNGELSKYDMQKLGLKGFATGTASAPGGMTLVGEQGPELVNLPQGSQVFSAGRTQQLMQSGGSSAGGGPVFNVTVNTGVGDPVEIGRQVQQFLDAYYRAGGR